MPLSKPRRKRILLIFVRRPIVPRMLVIFTSNIVLSITSKV
jgi:hypothetical protein